MTGILYAAVALPHEQGFARLEQGVTALLRSTGDDPAPTVLWNMLYEQKSEVASGPLIEHGIVTLPSLSSSLALEDDVLDSVRNAWQEITGADWEAFMRFEAREGIGEDED